MENGVTVLLLLGAVALNVFTSIRVVLTNRWNVWSGAQLGYSIFIGLPTLIAVFNGKIPDYGLQIPDFTPIRDLMTDFYLTWVGVVIAIPALIFGRSGKARLSFDIPAAHQPKAVWFCTLMVVLSPILSITFFLLSGKANGAGWYEGSSKLLQGNTFLIIISNFYNCARIFSPIALALLHRLDRLPTRMFLLLLLVTTLLEVILSGNRIPMFFALTSLLIAFPKKRAKLALWCALALPVILVFNHAYPIARGILWSNSYQGIDQAEAAMTVALDQKASESGRVAAVIGSACEAQNLTTLNFVINRFVKNEGFLAGQTMLLRPLLFFLPSSVWAKRPDSFNIQVGARVYGFKQVPLNATWAGEAYGNFGFFGPVVLVIFLSLLSFFYKYLGGYNKAASFYGFVTVLGAWRFDSQFIVIGAGAAILAVGASWLLAPRMRPHSRFRPAGPNARVAHGPDS
jgi:hypothetical protein